jgi:hypothetical protein
VLQHRKNHDSFDLVRVSVEDRPDLVERFRIKEVRRSPSSKGASSRSGSQRRAAARSSRRACSRGCADAPTIFV